MYWGNYCLPKMTEEALRQLQNYEGKARIIAGGTDLMPLLHKGHVSAKAIVDVSNIKELKYIKEESSLIKIGALTTHQQLASSDLLRQKVKILVDAAGSIGSPQIRNIGTIGGNIVSAQPAADTAIALCALNARARIKSIEKEEEKPVLQLYQGVGKSAVDATKQVLVEFIFNVPGENEAIVFMRHAKRKALSLPILNMGVWLKTNKKINIIEGIRIVLGPMDIKPLRAIETENVLKGQPLKNKTITKAKETLVKELKPRDSMRGSAFYKKEMAKVFLERAIVKAASDLGGGVND